MNDPIASLKLVSEASAVLSTSAVAVFGGTVAAVVSTSYRRPSDLLWRLPFLLFLPGWICLARSMYLGNDISGRFLASNMVASSRVAEIAATINDRFAAQQEWLLVSLGFFAAWLTLYLYYWMFGPATSEKK